MSAHNNSHDDGCFRLWPICLLFISAAALGNGTPIARSDVARTGNITPIGQRSIDLLEETLQISIDGDQATVRAEYHFVNSGGAATVAYGFPIDHVNPDWCTDCDDGSAEDMTRIGNPPRDVRIEANGQALATREVAEPLPAQGTPPAELLRTWILADLTFSAGERSVVTVSYKVTNRLNDMAWSTSFAPNYSKRKFAYQLSPSGNWGDGEVSRLDISVDIAKLTHFGGKLGAVAPAGYTKEGSQLRWRFSGADLRKMPDLSIEYDNSARLLSELIVEQRLPANDIAQARALSTLGAHDIGKLLDGDPSTAWCEGAEGDGVGQTLAFEFKPGVTVDAVGILNGYTKSDAIYRGNGRAARVTAEITREPRGVSREAEQAVSAASLPERDFAQLNRQALAPFIDWIVDAPYSANTREVTITIDAVKAGAKHADTCISEIYLLGSH